ncbi:MAG: hypothetical protein AB2712_05225 [Candidatus Thiodiazotropha sp.]
MTESESLFEDVLNVRGIIYRKIPEDVIRTPDYEVILDVGKTYWEVKELEENRLEKSILTDIISGKCNGYSGVDSNRVVNSIKEACDQFKKYGVQDNPCVIVLYDSRDFFVQDFLFTSSIKSALFGPSTYVENSIGELVELSRKYGLLTNRKRYVSAVGVLYSGSGDLSIYHNPYTSNPLTYNSLSAFHNQFIAIESKNGLVWEKIK